jgi:hypothetical protein
MGIADFLIGCLILFGVVSLIVGIPIILVPDTSQLYEYMKVGFGDGRMYDLSVGYFDVFKTFGDVFLRGGEWGAFSTAVVGCLKAFAYAVEWIIGTIVVIIVNVITGGKTVVGGVQ